MYGYIRQGQRTVLTREVIGGVPFWVLTAGRGWQRLRVRSLLRRLARHGVRTAVFEGDAWQTAAARYGIHPVPVGALRLAKLEELLDCLCPALSGKTVRLCVGKDGGTARQAAQVLAKRARYIELTPPGQTALAQWLLARYGVAAGSGGQQAAAVVWCGTADSVSEGPAIYLGADCAARQEVRYEAAGLAPWPVSEQLLAALLAADGWEASEIHVVSVVSRA
ncbi:MAG: hypothetical protein ACLVGP_01645 [Oscillospiraceae bacterium]